MINGTEELRERFKDYTSWLENVGVYTEANRNLINSQRRFLTKLCIKNTEPKVLNDPF